MGKSRTRASGRDLDLLERLKHENEKLKRQNSRLRKMIDRGDLDRNENVKELIESHDRLESEAQQANAKAQIHKTWSCWDCRTGILRLKFLDRLDGSFYYRVCDGCRKRTKPQKYVSKDEVQGVE